MKKGLKMICFVLAIVLVLSVASTAFAFTYTYGSGNPEGYVYGGPSQIMMSGYRSTTQPTWDLQSAYSYGSTGTWKMRGHSGGTTITDLVPINRGGIVYSFKYTSNPIPVYVSMYESIDSGNPGYYFYYTGTVAM